MYKLNFGCGSIQPEGWLNIDHDPEFKADNKIYGIPDESLDIIVAHASLQQVGWHDLVALLKVLRDKMRADGVIRISLPDIQRGFQAYELNQIDWFPNGEDNIDDRFSAWITWYSTTINLLTPAALAHKLKEAGFSEVQEVDFQKTILSTNEITELDTREHEFFFVEARK